MRLKSFKNQTKEGISQSLKRLQMQSTRGSLKGFLMEPWFYKIHSKQTETKKLLWRNLSTEQEQKEELDVRRLDLLGKHLLTGWANCWAITSWQGTLNSSAPTPTQTQRGREGGRRIPWRVPKPVYVTSLWPGCVRAGPPPSSPPRCLTSWALQEFPSSSHYSEETAGYAPRCCTATADRAETHTCDCWCWHRSMCALVVLSPAAFCSPTKEFLSVFCMKHQPSPG